MFQNLEAKDKSHYMAHLFTPIPAPKKLSSDSDESDLSVKPIKARIEAGETEMVEEVVEFLPNNSIPVFAHIDGESS